VGTYICFEDDILICLYHYCYVHRSPRRRAVPQSAASRPESLVLVRVTDERTRFFFCGCVECDDASTAASTAALDEAASSSSPPRLTRRAVRPPKRLPPVESRRDGRPRIRVRRCERRLRLLPLCSSSRDGEAAREVGAGGSRSSGTVASHERSIAAAIVLGDIAARRFRRLLERFGAFSSPVTARRGLRRAGSTAQLLVLVLLLQLCEITPRR